MTTPPKTMAEWRDAESENIAQICWCAGHTCSGCEEKTKKIFKTGFDCRDKLGDEELVAYHRMAASGVWVESQKYADLNEALNLAVEALEQAEAAIAVFGVTAYGHYNSKCSSLVAVKSALAEIRKLTGGEG